MENLTVSESSRSMRATDRGTVPRRVVGPMRWFAHPLGALLTILLAVLVIGTVEVLYAAWEPSYADGDFLYMAQTVLLFGTPIALLLGWPLSLLLDRVLLVRFRVRTVHVASYTCVAAVVPFLLVAALFSAVGGIDGSSFAFAGLIAAPTGLAAAVSRYLMRWFERPA